VLTTDQKGSIAEIAIAHAAIRLNIGVFKPLNNGERYDLVFDLRPRLVRVQCKWASKDGDTVVVRCRSCRRSANGFVRRAYSPNEVDAIAAYCEELDQCYYLPIERFSGRNAVHLRLVPPRNHQRAGINWADAFMFEATLGRSGAVAQLGERQLGMLEVTGSSPVGSIPQALTADVVVGAHEFRERFGLYMERAAGGEEIHVTRRGKPYARLVTAQDTAVG
jgi:prevent-host-death family protein